LAINLGFSAGPAGGLIIAYFSYRGLFFIFSFLVLPISNYIVIPIIGMLFLSIGEMISFPFSNTHAMNRSKIEKKGDYLALYTLTFSLSLKIGQKSGLYLANNYGYSTTWYVMAALLFFGNIIFFILKQQQDTT
jgi:predicted MFS family arabinose efflux permease